mgnify:CR=1 FL=1
MQKLLTLLGVVGFLALVIWQLTDHRQVDCNVCMEFKGQTHCALGSAPTREEAIRSGQTPACSMLASGVTESFQCSATPPISVTCEGGD